VKTGNNVGLDSLARNLASIVKVFDGGSVWASQVLTHQTHPTMDLALCTGALHAGIGRGLPQTVPTKLEA